MFSLLIVSYIVLAVFYINAINKATQPSPRSTVDVIKRIKTADGFDIQVPKVVVAGEPFTYETAGEKLVDVGADIRLQINCTVDGYDTPYTLGTFYSDQPKGEFKIKRTTTIALSSRLQPSEKCTMKSVATYVFYRLDNDGNENSFIVNEVGESNPFKLEVPKEPATQPAEN